MLSQSTTQKHFLCTIAYWRIQERSGSLSIKSFTKAKIFGRPLRAKRSLLGKSLTICTTYADCCTKVVEHRYGGAMIVVQTILWCSIGVVYGLYFKKWGVFNDTLVIS